MHIATQLAKWIQKIQPNDIPETVKERAKMSVLDTIGVTIRGTTDNVGRVIRQYVESIGGKPDCWLIGTFLRTSPPLAAMANGAMGHALDFDDTSYSYIGHPSVSVLPAALAIGEATEASGDQVLSAYIIGTEVACKLGTMATSKLFEDGWHTTSVIGAFGATAAATKLLGLTAEQIVHALAITVSEISGILGNIGTMSKPFQVGRSAENGLVAALLAKMGMTGSPDIFEKAFGFAHTFKVNNDFSPLYAKMGNPFDIDMPGFFLKEFPSCSATHPALKATIKLIREHKIAPNQVKSVDCAATPLVVNCLGYQNPQNAVEARFSMQYCLATALLNAGELTVNDFRDEKVIDPQIIKMMQKINLRVSSEYKKKGFAPSEGPEAASIVITLKGGKLLQAEKSFPDWRPDAMPSWDSLANKFKDCASAILSKDKLERSIEQIQRLELLKDIRELMASVVV